MSSQTANGKAFEYAIIDRLQAQLSETGSTVIQVDSEPLATAKEYFAQASPKQQQDCLQGAAVGVQHLIGLEPHLQISSAIELQIQGSNTGIQGDPRDVIISNREKNWEIGISCKNNHSDLKHSRLSPTIDFGQQWVGVPVSLLYWATVSPIFQQIADISQTGLSKWEQWRSQKGGGHEHKNQAFVIPILKAFESELKLLCLDPLVPSNLVKYIVGIKDFYQIMNFPSRKSSKIVAFNLYGKLSNSVEGRRERSRIPITKTPTSLISTVLRNTTLEVFFDQGWNLKFRLHTASSKIETSLKFAVGLCSTPTSAYVHTQFW